MDIFTEYRNQNAHRRYPFADDASLTSIGGTTLPDSFFVDAFLTPVGAVGPIYLGLLDISHNHLEFRDAGTGAVCGTADWVAGATTAEVWSTYAQIGIVVFGGAPVALGESQMRFVAAATPLTAACALPLLQKGVRGLVTAADGRQTSGDVVCEGRNGVVITSHDDGGGLATVRIDAYGTAAASPTDCDSTPLLKTVRLITEPCSRIVASAVGSAIYLMGANGFTLPDTCPKARIPDAEGVLPGEKDTCSPTPAPTPWECAEAEQTVDVPVTSGFLTISTPSTMANDNPFSITVDDTPGEALGSALAGSSLSRAEVERRMKQWMAAGAQAVGRLKLAMRGRIR